MPKQPTPAELEEQPSPHRVVRGSVLAALGRPPDLYEVNVRPLWGNHYRVNVVIGPDPTAVWIAHSYFLEVGEAGNILSASPRITRQYP